MSQLSLNYQKNNKDILKKFILKEKKKLKFERIFGNQYAKNLINSVFFQQSKPTPSEFIKEKKKNTQNDDFIILRDWRLLLFYGPPGVGKTMLMKTLSTQTDRTVFWVSITTLISKFSGESEKMVEVLFDMAREYQPSVVVIEEVDSIGRIRKKSEKDSERRFKIEFLKQMDLIAE